MNFKTSHVKVYQRLHRECPSAIIHFKTSHVKVYPWWKKLYTPYSAISKHPMLKFIGMITSSAATKAYFKTSHVKVYHRMVYRNKEGYAFQNIPC